MNNRSAIIKQGIMEAFSDYSKMDNRENIDSKQMTAQEVASVFAEDEIEMLMRNYTLLQSTPRDLECKINEEVIGQEEAVSLIAYAVYYNQKVNLIEEVEGEYFKRLNVMLVGPTGCGKGSIYEALKENVDVPVVKYTSDSITSAGYIGNKVENILLRLFMEAKEDLPRAERGIIFIDEIDKKRTIPARDGGKDINGLAVQEELLKILEPNIVDVTLPSKKVIQFDTSRLTVILMGAFVDLEDIKKKRLIKKNMGFRSRGEELSDEEIQKSEFLPEDFIEYGFIPEFVGRTLMIGVLRKLNKEDIMKLILCGKKSPYVKNTSLLANYYNVDQQISIKFLEKIAEELAEAETGVRALESRITKLFRPIIEAAMEHPNEYGICFIDEDGYFSLEYDYCSYYG